MEGKHFAGRMVLGEKKKGPLIILRGGERERVWGYIH